MRYFTILITLLLFYIGVIAQTNIQLIIQNPMQHKIDKVDAFDLSQKELHDYVYGDTLLLHFDKCNIDCYNIRYHEGEKMFRAQLWLDSGNIKIQAHLDEKNLVIDTVINSPTFYYVKAFAKQYFELSKTNDTALLNQFLLDAYEENIGNPFSIMVVDYFVRLNQNSKVNLLKLKKLTAQQGDRFSWFLMYPIAVERLNKMLTVDKLNANDFLFLSTPSAVTTTSLNSAVESFNTTVTSCLPLMEISCGANPTEEITSLSTPEGTLIENTPSELLSVLMLLFFAAIVAPITGCPFASDTLPVTVRSWARAAGAPAINKNNRTDTF